MVYQWRGQLARIAPAHLQSSVRSAGGLRRAEQGAVEAGRARWMAGRAGFQVDRARLQARRAALLALVQLNVLFPAEL